MRISDWSSDVCSSDLAAARPTGFALRDSARRLTWAEVKARVDGCAAALDASGLDKGERVSLWLSNRVEATIAFLACARQGYVCNPSLHRTYTVEAILGLEIGRASWRERVCQYV